MKNIVPKVNVKSLRLKGDRLYLRLLSKEDISRRYLGWMNDPEVVRFMRHRAYRSTMASLADFVNSRKWPGDLTLAMMDLETDLHIGNIGLTSIDWTNRKAELGMLLGDKNFWNKGYMGEAFRLITAYAFSELNLHKLYAGTEKDNKAAVRLFQKMGWSVEGEFKDDMIRDGKYVNVVRFAVFNKRKHS